MLQLMLTAGLLSCAHWREPGPPTRPTAVDFEEDPDMSGLRIRLFDTAPSPGEADRVRTVAGVPLSDTDLQGLLARLPDLAPAQGDRAPFALRPGSLPPPRTGADVAMPFPPPEPGPPAAPGAEGPLAILRYAPVGEVPLVPTVSMTFSQPMVAVTSQSQAAARVPATLQPAVDGHWRWLGTRTLVFDGDPRLPMATDYTVTVPAGTPSATGTRLAEALTFQFATPPVSVTGFVPRGGPQPLTPVMVLTFDQRVDPARLADRVALTTAGEPVAVRAATAAEIAADDAARIAVAGAGERRWIALVPREPLQRATTYQLRLEVGAPSAEGPRLTAGPQTSAFSTFPAFRIVEQRCGGRKDECRPTDTLMIRLNNPVDPDRFDPATVVVQPAVPGWSVQASQSWLYLSGAFSARRAYTVTVPASLTDVFGQALGPTEPLTFRIGPADPQLSVPGDVVVVLDPSGGATLPIASVNHAAIQVHVHAVSPDDWNAWRTWLEGVWYRDAEPKPLPGREVFAGRLIPQGDADRMQETALDFTPWLTDGHGQFVILVEPAKQPKERFRRQLVPRWVQVTDLGVTAFSDARTVVGWATDLATGAPAPGTELSIVPGDEPGARGTTGDDGLVALTPPPKAEGNQLLVARRGTDVAILPAQAGRWGGGGWIRVNELDQMRWYVTDERGLYRPGETVHVFGWIRRWQAGPTGDLAAFTPVPPMIRWRLRDPRGNDLEKGEVQVSVLGGFAVELHLPPDVNTGEAQLMLESWAEGVGDSQAYHPIQIAEFRRPEFEVTADAPAGPHLLGEDATVDLRAAYYAGGGLPGAEVSWAVFAEPGAYVPPGHDGYTFGRWSPWWRSWSDPNPSQEPVRWQATTDASGAHHLGMHFEAVNPPQPMTVRAEATVVDVNRQGWTSTAQLLVHPSRYYVGLRTGAGFVDKGKDVVVDLLAADLEGKVVPATEVTARFARLQSAWRDGRWQESEVDPTTCTVRTDRAGQGRCTYRPERGGAYRITARLTDPQGRPNESTAQVWVSGAEQPPARQVELEELTLVPEAQTLHAGDVARILVQAPFHPAEGVLTLRRSGLVSTERFTMEGPTTVLEVPIADAYVPDLTVQVDVVGAAPRLGDDGQPAADLPERVGHATGAITFVIPPLQRALTLKVAPADPVVAPGGKTSVRVAVANAEGQPVAGAELAVAIVDEAVLALTGFTLPDPLEVFYACRGSGVSDERLRSLVTLASPDDVGTLGGGERNGGPGGGSPVRLEMSLAADGVAADGFGGGAVMARNRMASASAKREDSGASTGPAIALRTDFSATARFVAALPTGRDGTVSVDVTIPDSLTRYRVMVVAVADGRSFGTSDAAITARKPLMVRPSAPRFLNFGDQLELPVVLQNQTDQALTVDLGVRATNLRFVAAVGSSLPDLPDVSVSSAGRRIKVPAQDRVEVRFPAATLMAGTARMQIVGASVAGDDAASLSLPVWTPATTEAFATTGSLDSGALVQPIQAPADVWTSYGGLEVTTSSTQLQALTDAVLYMQNYPFECNEQRASRVLAVASLRDVLEAFDADGLPDPQTLKDGVQHDLEELAARQNGDGGFAFWRRGDPSWPYLSIHVANAFARARAKGFAVPEPAFRASQAHLQQIERHIPSWYGEPSRWYLRAYALDVLRRMGSPDPAKAAALLAEAGLTGLTLDGQGFLLPTLNDARDKAAVTKILRNLGNHVAESADTAHFVTGTTDGDYVLLHSDRRADGVVLEALLEVRPQDDLVEKVVRDLLAHRVKGRWSNTQENAFVLLALDRYFQVRERETPDFVARMWLGDGFLGEHPFRGRSTDRVHVDVPMGYLSEHAEPVPLTLAMDGDAGRLYYRIALRYAPRDLHLDPADYGFAVARRYEAIDAPDDVRLDGDGTWRIRAGAQVRVRVTMANEMRRHHVALVDPLPAGLEPVNPELATSGTLPPDPQAARGPYWWWTRTWYEHENLRDERAEAFASLLWEGVHEYTYVARATTPGRFVVPPPRAEEMYSPETFGRGATQIVVITP